VGQDSSYDPQTEREGRECGKPSQMQEKGHAPRESLGDTEQIIGSREEGFHQLESKKEDRRKRGQRGSGEAVSEGNQVGSSNPHPPPPPPAPPPPPPPTPPKKQKKEKTFRRGGGKVQEDPNKAAHPSVIISGEKKGGGGIFRS